MYVMKRPEYVKSGPEATTYMNKYYWAVDAVVLAGGGR